MRKHILTLTAAATLLWTSISFATDITAPTEDDPLLPINKAAIGTSGTSTMNDNATLVKRLEELEEKRKDEKALNLNLYHNCSLNGDLRLVGSPNLLIGYNGQSGFLVPQKRTPHGELARSNDRLASIGNEITTIKKLLEQ